MTRIAETNVWKYKILLYLIDDEIFNEIRSIMYP